MANKGDEIPDFEFFDHDLFDLLPETNEENNDCPDAGDASHEQEIGNMNDNVENVAVPLDDEALTEFIEKNKSRNTKYKNISDKNVWSRWCDVIGETRNLENIPPVELSLFG